MTPARKLERAARRLTFRAAQAAKAWDEFKIALDEFIAASPSGLAPNPKRVEEVGERIAAIQEVLLGHVAAEVPRALKDSAAGSNQPRFVSNRAIPEAEVRRSDDS